MVTFFYSAKLHLSVALNNFIEGRLVIHRLSEIGFLRFFDGFDRCKAVSEHERRLFMPVLRKNFA